MPRPWSGYMPILGDRADTKGSGVAVRRIKLVIREAEVLCYISQDSMNRDEEGVILEDGRFIRQRKVRARRQNHLCLPKEPTIPDYNDDYSEL